MMPLIGLGSGKGLEVFDGAGHEDTLVRDREVVDVLVVQAPLWCGGLPQRASRHIVR